jgi:hypothetical protein
LQRLDEGTETIVPMYDSDDDYLLNEKLMLVNISGGANYNYQ